MSNESDNPLAELDAAALYEELREYMRAEIAESNITPYWVGIASGGAWLAERLAQDLGGHCGVISSALHRDDFAQRGLSGDAATKLPEPIQGADIWLIDDVLYTGRTVRAVLNELFDYGRPARVRLAVLVDRGQRELPVAADFAAMQMHVPVQTMLMLLQDQDGELGFTLAPRKI